MTDSQLDEIKQAANRQIAQYHEVATNYGTDSNDQRQAYAMGQEDGAHAILFIINEITKKAAGDQAND